MDVRFYNSLSDKLEPFKPIRPGEVSIYCCGPTVYDDAHVGNMRPVVVFDTLRRFMECLGYDVKLVSNITDVDDKIIKRAIAEKKSEAEIAGKYITAYGDLLKELNVEPYFMQPRVTEFMPEIISYIKDLVDKDAAYVSDGDVYFRVSSIKDYGELSNVNINDLIVGARVEGNEKKESPLDFALWKHTDEGITWDSPWGRGRPGWHTECCVMVHSAFGGLIDIHGGGFDLKFPHHENEIAQAKAHDGTKLADYWLHNGFLNIAGNKMSKSLGNIVTAKDFIAGHGGNVLRLLILSAHYRAPLTLSEKTVAAAESELARIRDTYSKLAVKLQLNGYSPFGTELDVEAFLKALADDLNTANALSVLFGRLKEANLRLRAEPVDFEALRRDFASIGAMLKILGIAIGYPEVGEEDIALYRRYEALRAAKDFAESDKLRAILIKKGIL